MFIGNAQIAQAQFFPATTRDETARAFTAQVNVANTGNSQLIVDNKLFRAMAWDGTGTVANGPGIFVDYNGNTKFANLGSPGGIISDPDIAAYQYDANVIRIFAAYVKGSDVVVERYEYNVSTNAILRVAAGNNQIISGATYPNVDVNEVGEGVVVYEKNTEIFARTINLAQPSPTLTPAFRVDYEAPGFNDWWASSPDVAIKKHTSGPGSTVSFIYKEQYTDFSWPYSDVIVKQEAFSTVAASTGTSGTTIQWGAAYYYSGLNYSEPYYPRIAVLHAPFMNDKDFAAVVQDGNLIASIASNNNGASYSQYNLNDNTQAPDLSNSYNEKPAIAYAGDLPIVAWTNTSAFSNGTDVISKRLAPTGIPINTSYSVVNYTPTGGQFAPSVSGTYYDAQALYTFYDKDAQTLLYKSSSSYNTNLRQANPNAVSTNTQTEAQLSVYPNPATDNSLIEITLQDAKQIKALELYNLTGQKVCSYDLSKLAVGSSRFNLHNKQTKNLPKGVYLLRLTTDKGQKVVKVLN